MNDEERWRIESDVRTLKEAEIIRNDGPRLKAAMSLMEEEMVAMQEAMGKKKRETTFGMFPSMANK